jgi:hypothetical protein
VPSAGAISAFYDICVARLHERRASRARAFAAIQLKGHSMTLPPILQGESITRLLQGAAFGAVATLVIGFYWGGWVTNRTAQEMTQKSASSAVVLALAPICVDKFRQTTNAPENLVELKKISSWQQGAFIEKGGWATMPGATTPDSTVARACAELLGALKT